MANFETAEPFVLLDEGGYCETPGDTGGETYEGISRNNFPNWGGWATVDAAKPLSRNEIIPNPALTQSVDAFYKRQFWDGIMGDQITDQCVATYLYDFYINAMHNAVKCVQRVIGVTPDGGFGPNTLNAINNYSGDLLTDLKDARIAYYKEIAVGGNAKFLAGWLARATDLYAKLC